MPRQRNESFDGAAFASLRKKKGFSRADVARHLQIYPSTVAQWETGKSTPNVQTLGMAIELLGIDLDDVVHIPESEELTLSELRVSAALSRQNVADALNVSQSTIGMFERAERRIPTNRQHQLADLYDVPLSTIRTAEQNTRSKFI